MEKYYLTAYKFPGKYLMENLINKILPRRKLPNNLHPYGKSMFWMLSPEAAMYVVNTVEADKKLKTFFFYTWGSDEFVFQTILMNSAFREKIINNNYRYIDWSLGGANPKLLDITDADALKSSGMLFARKFDMIKHPEILDFIDSQLIKNG
jgi:hypothetical protein